VIVESLIPDPRRPGSTRVFVAGRPAWTVPAEVIVELRLESGRSLGGDVVDRLDRAADEEGAVRAGLRALERRAHSEHELSRKLERKGHGAAAIAAAALRLRSLGLLDDLAFAKAYVSGRGERGRGPVRLRYDLTMLGVAPETIGVALSEVIAQTEDPLAQPRALLAKRAPRLAGLSTDARRRRLTAFLARRGYRGAEIRALVEEAVRM
jgi:regulatory protein